VGSARGVGVCVWSEGDRGQGRGRVGEFEDVAIARLGWAGLE